MIDPYTHCPRCNLPYKKGDLNADTYLHLACSSLDPKCYFKHFIDTTTRRRFQHTMTDGEGAWYTVVWLVEGISKVSFFYHEHDVTIRTMNNVVTFDHWLPFDITFEAMKVYMTFS